MYEAEIVVIIPKAEPADSKIEFVKKLVANSICGLDNKINYHTALYEACELATIVRVSRPN